MNTSAHHLIIGYGLTGQSIVNYLHRKKLPCTIYDDNPESFIKNPPPKHTQHTHHIDQLLPLKDYTEIFISPGIADEHPLMQKLITANIQPISDIELFLRHAKGKVIAITGSNGKSTVTRWLEYVLQQNNKSAMAIGNIGEPPLDYLDNPQKTTPHGSHIDYWIMEISSFQIQITPNLRADLATIINISEDHIDRHHTFLQYSKVKQTLLKVSKHNLLHRDEPATYLPPETNQHSSPKHSPQAWRNAPSYGLSAPSAEQDYGIENNYLMRGKTALLPVDKLPLTGKHNTLNALIVWLFAAQCGLDDPQIASTIIQWQGLPHRFQIIPPKHSDCSSQQKKITWINDSKSTNVGSMEVAIKSCMELNKDKAQAIFLIVGGQGKQADFSTLIPLIKQGVSEVLLFGEDAAIIQQAWLGEISAIRQFTHLHEIINYCNGTAKAGDYVLFSPGCASFDQFNNYAHRGECFIKEVQKY